MYNREFNTTSHHRALRIPARRLGVQNVGFAQETSPFLVETSNNLVQPADGNNQSVSYNPSAPAVSQMHTVSRSESTIAHNNMFGSIVGQTTMPAERCRDATERLSETVGRTSSVLPGRNRNFSVSQAQPGLINLPLSTIDTKCVSEMLHGLTRCSGGDEMQLVEFLTRVKQIFSIAPNSCTDVMKLILPYTAGNLFQIWLNAVQINASWEGLHTLIISRFFPSIHKRRIEALVVERQQFPSETFCDFVESVLGGADALMSCYTEGQLIEIILANMSPHTRNHIVFHTRPNTIWDLRQLAGEVNSSVLSDNRYFQAFNPQVSQGPSFSTMPPPQVNNVSSVTCFRCNRVGHRQNQCHLNLRRRR